MKKLLLTGFEPFLDFPINPTSDIVEALDEKELGGYKIYGRVLPVEYNVTGNQLIEHYKDVEPDDVISLGLAAGRHLITPERVAINCKGGAKDNRGIIYEDDRIDQEGPNAYFSKLPLRSFLNELNGAGYPADVSNTAGTYLCNYVMYTMLHYLSENNSNVRAGFVHIPASHELALTNRKLPSWSLNDLLEGIKIIIRTLEE
ncbi:pyroglutamyl-peptidase [Pullulanibacillus pueri]|uniref:Pyroglutamyl-peptidase I n=1 Tax=Pullulanibacillus pueri TaxID=1437324 RepID=A0A8J2ZZE3_9BACL|nr:pyroglutamyl-peptidase I [Pullulanibacillus pueri]MBM7683302.1 pyroglutamyl-peptidase [Pullulanibacillus pueri]GGH86457.1 pyrrolidone-carboxylate peptidase [Pullulanibacillus pueri]